jgi:predicted RNA-binding Zn-ribbon protein involved in translation (DUF1610 family)
MLSNAELVEQAMDLIESGEDSTGICRACGEEAYGVEPDAVKYKCESCGEREVYGAEEILITFG